MKTSMRKSKCISPGLATCALVLTFLLTATTSGQVHNNKPLELSGLSLSQAYDIQDGQPLDLDDPMILQLIYRIKKTSTKSRRDFSEYSKDVSWEQVSANTSDFRLWIFDRHVRLKKITKHRFAGVEKDDPIKGVFVCHCENEKQQPLIVLSRTAPRSLPANTDLDEPVKLTGFLFARRTANLADEMGGDSEAQEAAPDPTQPAGSPIFIVDRIAWYPDQVVEARSNESNVALAQTGVDIGLLDIVSENNARSLGNADSEAFYQMIGGVSSLERVPEFENPIGFVDLLQDAKSNFGNVIRIKGVVRSCSEVNIPNPDVVERIGVSKYYQLIVFPDLDGKKIVIKDNSSKDNSSKDNSSKDEDIEYQRFPVTVCCLQLPTGFSPASIERKSFLIDGFFFRFWKYQSDKTDAVGKSGQLSPLIIAKTAIPIASQGGLLNFILLCFAATIIVGFTTLLWWYRRVDRNRATPSERIIDTLPEQLDISGIEQ